MIEIIGFIAATLTTIAFIPQVVKIYITNETDDLSLSTFSLFTMGVFLWLIYGLFIQSDPVIFANAITFILAFYILFKIIMNTKRGKKL